MRKLIIAVVLLFLFTSCGKQTNVVPNVSVNFSIQLSNPLYSPLRTIGNAVLITGKGVAGVVIYNSVNGYKAYDRCSAYEPEKRCAVTLDNPSLTVTDPCSGSKWSLTDGTPVKAPAIKSLKEYAVNTNGFEIFVSN